MNQPYNPELATQHFAALSPLQVLKKIVFIFAILLVMPVLFVVTMNNVPAFMTLGACLWFALYFSIRLIACFKNQNFAALLLKTKSRSDYMSLLLGGTLGKIALIGGALFIPIIIALAFQFNFMALNRINTASADLYLNDLNSLFISSLLCIVGYGFLPASMSNLEQLAKWWITPCKYIGSLGVVLCLGSIIARYLGITS